jgi:hypothetical protein
MRILHRGLWLPHPRILIPELLPSTGPTWVPRLARAIPLAMILLLLPLAILLFLYQHPSLIRMSQRLHPDPVDSFFNWLGCHKVTDFCIV